MNLLFNHFGNLKKPAKTKPKIKQIRTPAFLEITSDRMKKDQMKYEAGDQARPEHTTATTATTTSTGFI